MKLPTKQLLFLISMIYLFACDGSKTQDENITEDVSYPPGGETPCFAPSDWFIAVDGVRKTPAPNEGPTSVFANNETVTNCDFHQWSWQKFLWLTNDLDGRPLFLDSLIQVSSVLDPITSEDQRVILTDTQQATGDTLITNSDFSVNNTTETVYYSIHVDSSLYKTAIKYGHLPKEEIKDVTFPVGALEVKVSWVTVNAISDTSSYFITDGKINGVDTRIALLGMHVVGIVENHPEFVWATFEHDDMVPFYDWAATTTADVPVTSSTNKLLFNKNDTATIANITQGNDVGNVFTVNQFGVPMVISNGKDTLMTTSQEEPLNIDNITMINESVASQLNDIWKNYFYNGSIWINTEGIEGTVAQADTLVALGSKLSESQPGKLTRGSVSASNITMETYIQVGSSAIYQQSVDDLFNCFTCHNASRGSALNISHIFNGYQGSKKGLSREEVKQKHIDEIKAFVNQRKSY